MTCFLSASRLRIRFALFVLSCAGLWGHAAASRGELPTALPPGERPADARLQPLKDLDGYFPFEVPASRQAWDERREHVRRQMLVSLGLWPMPSRCSLQAVVHGRIEREDYTVEKVYFQSMPGFFVTGNLYRPLAAGGKRPGVLCPHGHWADGRFYDVKLEGVREQIAQGAEASEEGGRSPLQARCVQLARMGCVVFHYDMIGYADSQQISRQLAHGFSEQRPEMNAATDWGLFSPQAETHFQSVMGLQTFNSIRALDFLCSLPDVDPQRLAVTGASGGGTQTFVLCGVDPRPAVAFPAVMVSTAMQGGCTCENACNLRIGTGNVEFAALFAPKPLGLSAADDWTKEMETKGFPELQGLYRLLDAADNVMLIARLQFQHNYNRVSRTAMYHWFNRQLDLQQPEPIEERDYRRLTREEMTVWDAQHPAPSGGPQFERDLLRWWHADAQLQLAARLPVDADGWSCYRELVAGALNVVLGRELPAAEQVVFDESHRRDRPGYVEVAGLLRYLPADEQLPLVVLRPARASGQAIVWLTPTGKAGLFQADGGLRPEILRLLRAGSTVIGADLLYQGEFLADCQPPQQTRRVENKRESAAYTFGYNPSLFAHRSHDVLTAIAYARFHEMPQGRVALAGLAGAGPWAAAACAQAGKTLDRAAIDTGGFRFGSVSDLHSPDFLPGGAKYGDLPGMLAVAAPGRLWLAGEGPTLPDVVSAAYRVHGSLEAAQAFAGPGEATAGAAVAWLLDQ